MRFVDELRAWAEQYRLEKQAFHIEKLNELIPELLENIRNVAKKGGNEYNHEFTDEIFCPEDLVKRRNLTFEVFKHLPHLGLKFEPLIGNQARLVIYW